MSWTHPRVPAVFMLVAGIAGLVTMPAYFSVWGALLIGEALLASSIKGAEAAD